MRLETFMKNCENQKQNISDLLSCSYRSYCEAIYNSNVIKEYM